MKGSIIVSPNHGVNPCIPHCFWCGKEKNQLALLGRLPKDAEAPRNAVFDYEPCDACEAVMSQGITIMESADGGKTPTGRYAVVKEEVVTRLIKPQELVEAILRVRKTYIEPSLFEHWFPEGCKSAEENSNG